MSTPDRLDGAMPTDERRIRKTRVAGKVKGQGGSRINGDSWADFKRQINV